MSLATLPPEILSCVTSKIESQPTLCNLAKCSRQLYLCTIPQLYHHVTVQGDTSQEEQQSSRLQNIASLLLRRPDLASLVRRFTFHDISGSCEGSKELDEPEDSENHLYPKTVKFDPAFKTAVKALSLSQEEENDWLNQLSHTRNCHPDLILALLLPALLKVERLELDFETDFYAHYLERIIRRAACRERPFDIQPAFQALKVLVHSHKDSNLLSTDFFASLLKLPEMRAIIGGVGNKELYVLGEDKNLIALDSSSSRLVTLDLSAYALSTADLCHMLRVPKALKVFSYEIFSPTCINFTDIRRALEPQENCLWRLGFGYDDEYEYWFHAGVDTEFFGPMTSFTSFNTLKIFETAALFLETTENGIERHRLINIFPPNLETLHVNRCQESFESLLVAVEHLLAQKAPQQLPLLKELILEGTGSSLSKAVLWSEMQGSTVMEDLSRVAAARGISIVLINMPGLLLNGVAMAQV